jgi:hypothetical protein
MSDSFSTVLHLRSSSGVGGLELFFLVTTRIDFFRNCLFTHAEREEVSVKVPTVGMIRRNHGSLNPRDILRIVLRDVRGLSLRNPFLLVPCSLVIMLQGQYYCLHSSRFGFYVPHRIQYCTRKLDEQEMEFEYWRNRRLTIMPSLT